MNSGEKPEIQFVVKTRDHEEYVLNAIDNLLAALDECAWAQVLPILGDEVYNIKGHAEMIRSALKDHTTIDLCEDGTFEEREETDEEYYPNSIVFYSKHKVSNSD